MKNRLKHIMRNSLFAKEHVEKDNKLFGTRFTKDELQEDLDEMNHETRVVSIGEHPALPSDHPGDTRCLLRGDLQRRCCGVEVSLHKRIQFLESVLMCFHSSIALHDYLHYGVLQTVVKCFAILFGSNSIGSCSQEVCGDLSRLWVGNEQEPHSNANKDFQHHLTSFPLTARRSLREQFNVNSLI